MRIRQVKPEFWSDKKLRTLTDTERLVFIGLWMQADDSGFMRWEPEQMAAELFPYANPLKREAKLAKAGVKLQELGRLVLLEGCQHAVVPRLTDHQRFAGQTKQVHTFRKEHEATCSPAGTRGHPRGSEAENTTPTDTRGSPRFPARLGQVRSGQVRSSSDGAPTGSDPAEDATPGPMSEQEVEELRRFAAGRDPAMASMAKGKLKKAGLAEQEEAG